LQISRNHRPFEP